MNNKNSSVGYSNNHLNGKLDFKNNCTVAGGGGVNNGSGSSSVPPSSLGLSPASPDSQQFNIFPAIFSRQLNFSAGSCGQQKLMDELRPNLVGGLLGLQQGLLDDHALAAHGQLQHNNSDTKFMSLQDNHNRFSHENRLLGLTQDGRNPSSLGTTGNLHVPNGNDNKLSNQRKCSTTPEDFNALYGGLSNTAIGDTSSHHHTPAHTPPNRLSDHNTVTGKHLTSALHATPSITNILFFLSFLNKPHKPKP